MYRLVTGNAAKSAVSTCFDLLWAGDLLPLQQRCPPLPAGRPALVFVLASKMQDVRQTECLIWVRARVRIISVSDTTAPARVNRRHD